jgi:hypothetical protein
MKVLIESPSHASNLENRMQDYYSVKSSNGLNGWSTALQRHTLRLFQVGIELQLNIKCILAHTEQIISKEASTTGFSEARNIL